MSRTARDKNLHNVNNLPMRNNDSNRPLWGRLETVQVQINSAPVPIRPEHSLLRADLQVGVKTTIVVARSEDGWKIAAWRVMTFDETLLNMLRE
ncbi:MAG: hypothetical protein IH919_11005 [Deltaproteobacteria bacterium]|nr:hypothetical protein [Deltaproteobacteria bacterium]